MNHESTVNIGSCHNGDSQRHAVYVVNRDLETMTDHSNIEGVAMGKGRSLVNNLWVQLYQV